MGDVLQVHIEIFGGRSRNIILDYLDYIYIYIYLITFILFQI